MKNNIFNRKNFSYNDNTHFYGRIWGLSAVVAIMVFPIACGIIFKAWPTAAQLAKGLLGILPIFWTIGIVEVLTYTPMLGASSTYLGFVTGNLSNLKVPCALNCMKNADVKAGTPEGDIISTISTAVSSIVTILVIILGVCLIIPLTPVLESPKVAPAFVNILPALFGALAVVYISRNWKIALPPVILMIVLFIAIPALNMGMVSVMVPVGAVFTIIVSRIMYKKGWLNPKKSENPIENDAEVPDVKIDEAEIPEEEISEFDAENPEKSVENGDNGDK